MKSLTLPFWIGLLLFSIYMLGFSGKFHVMDEFVGFAVGNNLIQHGRADVNQFIWTNHWHTTPPGIWGKDDNLYTKKAPGISLAAIPFIWIGHNISGLSAVHLSLLTSALATALTGGLLFLWLAELGYSRFVATFSALAYGLGTIAWVYARFLWEHSIMGLLFLIAIWAVFRAVHQPHLRIRGLWILVCSAALACSLTMRFEAIPAVLFVGLYLFLYVGSPPDKLSLKVLLRLVTDKMRWIWLAFYLALPTITVLWLLYFNFVRFGQASETGYNREILFEKPWVGAFGMLFSPSTGLFIYAPLMILLIFGLRPAWRRLPHPYFSLIASLCLFYWIFYGSWFSWGSTWVWGPRFFLHTWPLLMLFIAEVLTWGSSSLVSLSRVSPRGKWMLVLFWAAVAALTIVSVVINFLGVVVDLNEHFLRLGRNDNYVFNWQAFPPLGHWRILQEGLIDISWLRITEAGLVIEWAILGPLLLFFGGAALGLFIAFLDPVNARQDINWGSSIIHHPLTFVVTLLFSAVLIYFLLLAAAQLELAASQAQADAPILDTLTARADPNDVLLIAMPPFGDVQEISTHIMAYLDQPVPTYAWIESEPKAVQPDERERIWQASSANADQVWLFERWRSQDDPMSLTTAGLNQDAFLIDEAWFAQSGKLARYALAQNDRPALSLTRNVPFQGGVTLVDFAVMDNIIAPGEVLKIRLIWQAASADQLALDSLPAGGIVSFVHLLNETSSRNVAQHDRLLLDLQNIDSSTLLPGQATSQGYGLELPDELAPGSYPLIVGLYAASSGQRLFRADESPDDFLYLTNIVVAPED